MSFVAEKIAHRFDGHIRLSFSAEVEEKSVNNLVEAGI